MREKRAEIQKRKDLSDAEVRRLLRESSLAATASIARRFVTGRLAMKFSVLIVNYASWPLTLHCIESLQRTRYGDFEIIVVDNDIVEPPELPSGVRLIRNKENVGFARAHNTGIAASNGDPVVIINPDTVVERDFFEHLETFVSKNPRGGHSGTEDP